MKCRLHSVIELDALEKGMLERLFGRDAFVRVDLEDLRQKVVE